jgi:hypothetical protein
MGPIEFEIEKVMNISSKDLCETVLDAANWSDFDGYGVLPGIEKAEYEEQTDQLIGSRILVKNSDSTEHIEEIMEWEPGKRLVMKLHEFPAGLSFIATHFIEEWNFEELEKNETLVKRKFQLFPTNFITRPFLSQVASLMEKAIEKHLDEMAAGLRKK